MTLTRLRQLHIKLAGIIVDESIGTDFSCKENYEDFDHKFQVCSFGPDRGVKAR